jgi:hypothetical protein
MLVAPTPTFETGQNRLTGRDSDRMASCWCGGSARQEGDTNGELVFRPTVKQDPWCQLSRGKESAWHGHWGSDAEQELHHFSGAEAATIYGSESGFKLDKPKSNSFLLILYNYILKKSKKK